MLNINKGSDTFFIFIILILAFSSRMIIAPLYISLPGEAYSIVPHDFVHYVDDAKVILEGKTLYVEPTHNDRPAPYGPVFLLMVAGIIKFFGGNYLVLKLPAVLSDIGIIVVLFYLTRNLFGSVAARYAAIFYGFSLIPLLISGADATADLPLVFFLILSVFFLTKKSPNILLSAVSLGLSAGFKAPLSVIFLPIIAYFFFQTKQYKSIFLYLVVLSVIVFAINFPFFVKAGTNIIIQITYGLQDPIGGTSFESLMNILVNYFIYGVDERTRLSNPVIALISFPILLLASLATLIYILKFSLKDKRIELIRNVVFIILVLATFVKASHWHIFFWSMPFIFILIFYNQRMRKFSFSNSELFGVLLLVTSSIVYATLYRWTKIPEYTSLEQFLLFTSIFLSAFGVLFMLAKTNFRYFWSFSTFSWHLWLTDHAKLFMLLGFIIPVLKNPAVSFGAQHFLSIALVVASTLLILLFLHKRISVS